MASFGLLSFSTIVLLCQKIFRMLTLPVLAIVSLCHLFPILDEKQIVSGIHFKSNQSIFRFTSIHKKNQDSICPLAHSKTLATAELDGV